MSLVENIINQISVGGGITKPQGFDLNDDTFAKLLEKASAKSNDINSNFVGEIKEINVGDYFSSLLKTNTENNDLMDFAKKQVASFYAQQSKPIVLDSTEFVSDLLQNQVAN